MVRYLVVFERAGDKYAAYVPDLPGCFAAGATLPEVKENIRKVIRQNIRGIVMRGEALPEQVAFSEYIDI
ncbi:MAG: type II toxin-antitoxin system HicB family antitoxin [Chloroflexi bacterium]|nr:type II toxin-antitoxin system HicB family antitoxin [Chloroflexota bacterium]